MNAAQKFSHVLLIEDDDNDAEIARRALLGAASTTFGDFPLRLTRVARLADGLEILGSENTDIVLSDLGLPDSSGVETVVKILKHFPETSLIVLTGRDDESSGVAALRAGAIDYISKSENEPRAILRTVAFALERRNFADERAHLADTQAHAQRLQALGTLAGGVAHDFRNELAVILTTADTIRQTRFVGGEPLESRITRIVSAASRAKELVDRILLFSRRDEPRRTVSTIDRVVGDSLELLVPTLPSNITIEYRDETGGASVVLDVGQIHHVIVNLCTNAAHAIGSDAGLVTIVTRYSATPALPCPTSDTDAADQNLELVLTDDGPGLAPGSESRLFEPFFTTKPIGEGTGLGLSVVHGVVTSHDGTIQVDSKPGAGTTFVVSLPCIATAQLAPLALDNDAPLGEGERIVLVDDQAELAETTREILEGLGYAVNSFSDPVAALGFVRTNPEAIDLLLTDAVMPGVAGGRVASLLHQIQPNARVVVMTDSVDEDPIRTSAALYADACVLKPFSAQKIARILRTVLDHESLGAPE
jgi:two-component system cell cycle sensor histidine kinase/response regulator CckA